MKKDTRFTQINKKLAQWLADVKQSELLDINEFIDQAKQFLSAAESIPEENVKQFLVNLKYDLSDFYQQTREEAKHSIYLGLMGEIWWQTLSNLTDKSQIEWAELEDDFAHDGFYHSGDVIGFGILSCQHCYSEMHVTHFSTIIDCIECGHSTFIRKPLEP